MRRYAWRSPIDKRAASRRALRGRSACARRGAFTLVEVLLVVFIVVLAVGLAIPGLGDTRQFRLRAAARLLVADLEYAQHESIAHADDPRLFKVDAEANRYWIAPTSAPDSPIADPAGGQALLIVFGAGKASGVAGVAIQSFNLGGDNALQFSACGQPDQSSDATVVLTCGGSVLTVRVTSGTGEVRIDP